MSQTDEYEDVDVLVREGKDLSAEADQYPDIYGRDVEVDALARALSGGTSAVLLGPSGVGKTAVIRKFLRSLRLRRLGTLTDAVAYEVSTAGLCSGTRYTGMQEGKIRALLKHATRDRLVFIPDLWNVPTAGSYETNPRGIYDLMRPGIEAQTLVLFGEMSQGRWERLCREHKNLERDFATITVGEMDEDETREVLWMTAHEWSPRVTFDRAAIERIYTLTRKFCPAQSFPGKAVDLLRRVAHATRPTHGPGRTAPVDVTFVEEFFAADTGLPAHMISPRVHVSYESMHSFLSERVLGQPEAVSAVADVLALYKTGLSNPDRPAGVLLFVGPTGVGKTELAKATAEFLFGSRERICRFDISEFKDYHSFEKLIGDPKRDQPGLLTEHVRHNPFTVVLLDEFEKGHANLADLFLQVFDDGRLTDATGETVDFRHALIIMTTNVGSDQPSQSSIGFGDAGRDSADRLGATVQRALEMTYRPEFLNRLDRILLLKPLNRDDMRRIARRELRKIYEREGLLDRHLMLEIDEGVVDLLLDRGFDPKYGARPLKRAIEENVVVPLARALLGADARNHQLLRLARSGESVVLSFEETESSKKLSNLDRPTRTEDGAGGVIHLSLADVRTQLSPLSERMVGLADAMEVSAMRKELREIEALDASGHHPGLWEEALGPEGHVVRRHELTSQIRRFDELENQVSALRELVEASFTEAEDSVAAELTTAFSKLDRQVRRAEREIVHFGAEDKGSAVVWIRPVGGKLRAHEWASSLAGMYEAWALRRGFEVERSSREDDELLTIVGPCAYGYLRSEHGGHRLIDAPTDRHRKRPETLLARVDVSPADGEDPANRVPAVLEDDPPIRTYDLWRSRGVRDRQTSHAEGDVRRVLAGRIDGFIDSAIDARRAASE